MNKKTIIGGTFAAVAAIVAASSFISCSSDDEYYENGNYTLANKRMTRSGIEPGLPSIPPPPIRHSFNATFTFKHSEKPDSTITRSASGTVTVEFDSLGLVADRAYFSWTPDNDITIINEDATYHDSHLFISAQAAYTESTEFGIASWGEIVVK